MFDMGLVKHAHFKLGIMLLCQAVHLTATQHTFGHLSVLAPTFIGRNITFQLKPTSPLSYEQYEACTWIVLFKGQPIIAKISGYSLFELDGMKMMELDSDYVNSSWDGAFINVNCNNQESTYIYLKLEDFKNECGFLNVLSYPEGPGGIGQIAYFPTAKVLRNPDEYERTWIRDRVDISYLEGVYEERTDKLNFKYILTVFNINGLHRYNVRCKKRKTETNEITLFDGRPVLSSLCSVDKCSDCVCVKPGDRVSCITYSTNVSLWIGNIKLQLQRTQNDSLYTYNTVDYTIKEEDHQSTVLCSASYDNTRVVNASALMYVYVPPKLKPELILPELREGSPVNITCVTSPARPPPIVQMFLDGLNITDVFQYNVYNATNRAYTAVATLKSANRTWNNKNITCRYLVTYPDGQYDSGLSTKSVIYKYPPSRLLLLSTQTPVGLSAWYQLAIRCQLTDSNTQCELKWTTKDNTVQTMNVQTTKMTYTESVLHVNVSANSSGQRITCHAECEEFSLQLKEESILDLPNTCSTTYHDQTPVIYAIAGSCVIILSVIVIACIIKRFKSSRSNTERQEDVTLLQVFSHHDPAAEALPENREIMTAFEHHYYDIEDLDTTQALHQSTVRQQVSSNEQHNPNHLTPRGSSDRVNGNAAGNQPEQSTSTCHSTALPYEDLKRSGVDPENKYTPLR